MKTCESKTEWNLLMGTLKQEWVDLTYDDLYDMEDKPDELVRRIQKRTGESRTAIESAIRRYRAALAVGNCHNRMHSQSYLNFVTKP